MSNLERGFKSWAEHLAADIRKDLQLGPQAPFSPKALADYLDVQLLTPRDIHGMTDELLDQLLGDDPWSWSAVTLVTNQSTRVIFNPKHSVGRRASTLMHELAHLLLDHKPSKVIVSYDGSIVMRTFDAKQEEEAGWLAGCLLLPRIVLLRVVKQGHPVEQIASEYGVTEKLANYRIRICGVDAQVRALTRR